MRVNARKGLLWRADWCHRRKGGFNPDGKARLDAGCNEFADVGMRERGGHGVWSAGRVWNLSRGVRCSAYPCALGGGSCDQRAALSGQPSEVGVQGSGSTRNGQRKAVKKAVNKKTVSE